MWGVASEYKSCCLDSSKPSLKKEEGRRRKKQQSPFFSVVRTRVSVHYVRKKRGLFWRGQIEGRKEGRTEGKEKQEKEERGRVELSWNSFDSFFLFFFRVRLWRRRKASEGPDLFWSRAHPTMTYDIVFFLLLLRTPFCGRHVCLIELQYYHRLCFSCCLKVFSLRIFVRNTLLTGWRFLFFFFSSF